MTWKEERDALIAQTMAFVQSVTGKPADFAQFELPAVPTGTPVTPQQAVTARGTPAAAQPARDGTAAAQPALANTRPSALPEPSPAPATVMAMERFTSIAAQLDLQRDMQAEIRARVARFRAHQERFNRERQEYFSATLARLKASAAGLTTPED